MASCSVNAAAAHKLRIGLIPAQDVVSLQQALARACAVQPVELVVLAANAAHEAGALAAVLDLRPNAQDAGPPSRFGTWRFCWDGMHEVALAGVAALQAGRRDAGVALMVGERVLEHCRIKTVSHSLPKTQDRLFAAAATMPIRMLLLLEAGLTPPASEEPAEVPGTALEPVARLTRAARLRNLAGRILREAWEEQWRVGVLDQTPEQLVAGPDARRITWLPARQQGYHADPFGQAGASGRPELVLAEAYDFKERLGYLVAIDRDGSERTVLREPFHLSYPQLVEHDGQTWLLPEAKAAGLVRLYRGDPFPERFVPGPVLIDGLAAADPTLFRDSQGFWLFAGDGAAQDETNLVLYRAPDLLGPWTPHPMNPIKVDLGSARPAGPLFRAGGRLWRPAQDCRATYGGAIVLNEVLTLTPDLYLERPGPVLRPDPAGPCPHGLHTLTPFGQGFLVDGKRESRSLRRWLTGLRSLAGG
ncbi:MAG TPA: hypothetical protein VNS22_02775 [Geminicoccus sp.]|uniref:glucosamine inositolphosphorylceramide transferase family protein n=1 Tax=Geminicoccus sp. TaxID=2024832 RepID=UPI002BD467FE|nr:hypothetical protein [Geminicoccus sp.]HWL67288.1 hypothetical protein [Geminicoccus sp.]